MGKKDELIELNQPSTIEDICTIENNFATVEKIYKDIYCNIPKKYLKDVDISTDKYNNIISISIYKGNRSIKTIVSDNKYYIFVSRYREMIAVLKISNIDNKVIEFNKTNSIGDRFNPAAFFYDNNFIMNITYKKKN